MGILVKVLVCGGRNYNNREKVFDTLNNLAEEGITVGEIIEGGARGADRIGREWALENGIKVTTVEADWNQFGKSAGYIRNNEMVKLKPDIVVAFKGGKGTANMVKISEKENVPVIIEVREENEN